MVKEQLKEQKNKSEKNNEKNKSNKDEFYVKVLRTKEIRRQLLLSSKSIIEGLKEYETLKSIREERFKKIEEFKNVMKEIQQIVGKIREMLPHYEVFNKREISTKKQQFISETIKRAEYKNEALIKLEKELAEIESRLNNI